MKANRGAGPLKVAGRPENLIIESYSPVQAKGVAEHLNIKKPNKGTSEKIFWNLPWIPQKSFCL